MKTKIFTLFLVLISSVGTMFASNTQVNSIWYDFNESSLTATVTYRGSSYSTYSNEYTGAVVIPSTVTYSGKTYSVTSIGKFAFDGCDSLTSVTIPNSVTSIGMSAFYGCSSLTSVTIGNSVTSIGYAVFYNCSGLTSVTIPNSVTSIGYYAFYGCSGLTSVTIPNSVTSIEQCAFSNCTALTSVTIPNSVTNMGESAFSYCSGLTSVTIPNSITSIGKSAFSYCTGLTSIEIPNSVTSIGASAFDGCSSLSSVTIPNSVTSIGSSAFSYCTGLTSIEIPNSVTSIGASAFYKCSSLTSVTIPDSVTSIGNDAFYKCSSLTSVTIPNSVTSIGSQVFGNCSSLISVTINSDAIVSNAYTSSSSIKDIFCEQVTEYIIGDNVTSIGDYAFYGCSSMISVTIPNSITSIGEYAFRNCTGLTSVTIPNNVTGIGSNAFYGCSGLTSVTIGNSVTGIGNYAFQNCTGLTSVTIPNNVTGIGINAFSGCTGLTKVNISDLTAWCKIRFLGSTSNPLSYAKHLFLNDVEIEDLVIPNSVTGIGDYTFYGCSSLTSVTIPNSVTSIGINAFYGCSSLTSVTIPNNVTNIGSGAFYNCTGLTSVTIPNNVTNIGSGAFYNCTGLTSIKIPSSVTSIGDKAFYGCTGLTDIYAECRDLERIKQLLNDDNRVKYLPFSYTLIALANNGKITTNIDEITICDSNVTCYATPDYGYHFKQWSDGVTDNPRTIELTHDTTFAAEFAHNPVITYIYNSSEGSVSGDTITPTGVAVDTITFEAISNYGYHFVQWSDGNTDNPRTIVLTQDSTFTAEFAVDKSGTCGANNALTWLWDNQSKTLTITGNGALTENYTFGLEAPTQMQKLVIGNKVTAIGVSAFYNCSSLTSVTIGNGVTSIGNDAFYGCNSLTAVSLDANALVNKNYASNSSISSIFGAHVKEYIIGNSVTGIGNYAFYKCTGLTSLTIGDNVTSIGGSAFYGCTGLTTIEIPDNVTNIGEYAFSRCTGLTSLTIPNSVTNIGSSAFYNCTGLTSIKIPSSVTTIGNYAFYECTGLTFITLNSDSIVSKAYTYSSSLKNIFGSQVTKYIIGDNVQVIGKYAFYGYSSLTSLIIGNSVTSLGDYAFYGCTGLTSVIIPNNVTTIGNYAFYECTGLTSLTIGDNVTSIGGSAFYGCIGLTSIEIPNSVTKIGSSAFYGCTGLTSIEIPNSGTSVGSNAFGGCNGLKTVTLNSNVVVSNNYTYSSSLKDIFGEQVTEYIIGDNVKGIGEYAFYGCTDLTEVTIPNSVTSIGDFAFDGCTGLISIEIPNSVTSIGNYAFNGCTGLISIEIPTSVASIGRYVFQNCTGLSSVTLNSNAIVSKAYTSSSSLKDIFGSQVTEYIIGDNVKGIGEYAFYGCTDLTEVTISNSVTSIGDNAFYKCYGLTRVNISDLAAWCYITFAGGVSNPLQYAKHLYLHGSEITDLVIPNSVTSIRNYAFTGFTSLTSVTIGNSVTSIGDNAFSGCTGLKKVTLNSNAVVSKNYTYSSSLKNIFDSQVPEYIIGDDVTSIGNYAFYDCTGLTSITIGISVTSIGSKTFSGCSGLKKVKLNSNAIVSKAYTSSSSIKDIFGSQVTEYIIGDNVKGIGDYAFYECTCLSSMPMGKKVINIGEYAFSGCTGFTSVTIPNNVTTIGNYAFYECTGLTRVNISDLAAWCYITFAGGDSNPIKMAKHLYLNGSEITNLVIPNSVTSIGTYAFYGWTSLTSVTIPNSVTHIGGAAFVNCTGLTSLTIPNSVTSIGEYAFWGCVGLTSMTLGSNVDSIGNYAFHNCTGLTSIICYATTPPILGNSVFSNVDCAKIPLYVPQESVSQYKATDVWKYFIIRPIASSKTVTVNASASHGIVEGAGEYDIFSNITLKVIPEEGYVFKQWSDGVSFNQRSLVVSIDTTLTAVCEEFQEPINTAHLPYNEPFTSNVGKFSIKNVSIGGISYVWTWASANYGMKASAYFNNTSHAAESWLISPPISLMNASNIVLSFQHAVNKGTPGYLSVKISTDLGRTWSDLSISNWPAGTNWNFVSISESLDAYTNSIVQIAFVYVSTSYNCPTWEVKNFSVTGTVAESDPLPIAVDASETTADVTWLKVPSAATYELVIRDPNWNVICVMVFDGEGHLMNVENYTPTRKKSLQQEQANEFAYTITELNSGTEYHYMLVAKDNTDKMITTYSGTFKTDDNSTDIEEVKKDLLQSTKILRNGQIYILRGGKTYTTDGRLVR